MCTSFGEIKLKRGDDHKACLCLCVAENVANKKKQYGNGRGNESEGHQMAKAVREGKREEEGKEILTSTERIITMSKSRPGTKINDLQESQLAASKSRELNLLCLFKSLKKSFLCVEEGAVC